MAGEQSMGADMNSFGTEEKCWEEFLGAGARVGARSSKGGRRRMCVELRKELNGCANGRGETFRGAKGDDLSRSEKVVVGRERGGGTAPARLIHARQGAITAFCFWRRPVLDRLIGEGLTFDDVL